MTKIGFIGLGNMGLPMSRNLVKAGHEVKGFDLNEQAVAELRSSGGIAVDALADAVRGVDVVMTMLPAGKHVRSVYLGDDGILGSLEEGTLLIDSSTIDVATSREVHDKAEKAGFDMIDAPVSGGVGGAEAGTLTFMVGGSETAFNAAKPVLEVMGGKIVHTGGAGNGQAAKICNNMLLAISMVGVAEAFALGRKLGLTDQTFFDVAATSSGQCWALTSYCPVPGPVPSSPANRDYAPGFAAAMMHKDLKLAQNAAEESGADTPLGNRVEELYAAFDESGHGGLDFSAIFKRINGEL